MTQSRASSAPAQVDCRTQVVVEQRRQEEEAALCERRVVVRCACDESMRAYASALFDEPDANIPQPYAALRRAFDQLREEDRLEAERRLNAIDLDAWVHQRHGEAATLGYATDLAREWLRGSLAEGRLGGDGPLLCRRVLARYGRPGWTRPEPATAARASAPTWRRRGPLRISRSGQVTDIPAEQPVD